MVDVTFFGVRGSTPSTGSENMRYGGNTACVVVTRSGADPIVLDLGTGLRAYGESLPEDVAFRGTALLTHMHWDHVQGLPFFTPILRDGAELVVYGPRPDASESLSDAFSRFLCPPYFPVTVEQLYGEITFHDVTCEDGLRIGDAAISACVVPHPGLTFAYRIDVDGVSVVYVSDHQQPRDGSSTVDESVLTLCRGADLLIHDAQFTQEELAEKLDWGHCTVDFAVTVARQAGVRRLALFHHDPLHDDKRIDCLVDVARHLAGPDLEVMAAAEGLTVALG